MDRRRPFLSVIVPTIGRSTLPRALDSIRRQVDPTEVEILVVGDSHGASGTLIGDCGRLAEVAASFEARYLEHDGGRHMVGHPQRNAGLRIATGAWLAFLDDDDVWTDDAYRLIAARIAKQPDAVHLFRMRYPPGSEPVVLWATPVVAEDNVGTPMIVVRNRPELLGVWGDRYAGDFDFISTTVEKHVARRPGDAEPANPVAWWPDVICDIRPS